MVRSLVPVFFGEDFLFKLKFLNEPFDLLQAHVATHNQAKGRSILGQGASNSRQCERRGRRPSDTYLNMGSQDTIICPYCALKAGETETGCRYNPANDWPEDQAIP
jgi:hypothetical protein